MNQRTRQYDVYRGRIPVEYEKCLTSMLKSHFANVKPYPVSNLDSVCSAVSADLIEFS